ncbi:hypothetical protein BDFB_014457, partial [Asbolus verrucosus]
MLEMYYRNSEKIDGQWIYFTRNAFEDFQETFPDVIGTGSVGLKKGSGRPNVRNVENVEAVRQAVEQHPNTSIRHLQQANLSCTTCQRTLSADRYRLEILTPFIETLLDDELTQDYF